MNGVPRPKPAGFNDSTPRLVAIFDDGQHKELMRLP
jgi:hypothetical protein